MKKGSGSGPAAVVGYGKAPDDPDVTTAWPLRSGAVIEAAAILALALRLFQLSRPGYLSGFTQYDDGVYFGDALRLVHGAIAYRDFAMVQPPASMLLMAPVALAGEGGGTIAGPNTLPRHSRAPGTPR